MIALIVISTGERYWKYVDPLIASVKKYFFVPHDVILFTDSDNIFYRSNRQFPKHPEGYPLETLHRYHTILAHESWLHPYSHIFYIDVDCIFVSPVGEEILSDGITATLHAGFSEGQGAWETRRESKAWVNPTPDMRYFCGGFNGGTREAYFEMARTIAARVDADERNGITAIWHDESHLNCYLVDHPPTKILEPEYCWPEPRMSEGRAKIMCLEKTWHES